MPKPKQYSRKPKAKVSDSTKEYVKKQITQAKNNKFNSVDNTSVSMAYDADVPVCLTTIPRGTAETDRLGEVIKLKAFYMRFQILLPLVYSAARVIIFQWKPSNTAENPSWNALFNRDKNSALGIYGVKNDESLDKGKFKILYDKSYVNTSGIANTVKIGYAKIYEKKFGNKFIKYEPTTNTGAGNIYLYITSNNTVAVGAPSITYATRCIFQDN